jgi:hypothetical protein
LYEINQIFNVKLLIYNIIWAIVILILNLLMLTMMVYSLFHLTSSFNFIS